MTIFTSRRIFGASLLATATALALPWGVASAQSAPLRIGYANVGAFEPFFIAQRNGWFEEAGLNVELIEASNPQQNIARLMSGELDVVGSGSTPAIAAIAQGVPIQIVMGNQEVDEQPTVGLFVRADSPYQSIADLAGQQIGTVGLQGTGALMVHRAFREAGLPFDSAELVNMPLPTVVENLENGNVEAIVPFALFYDLALGNPEFRLIPEPYETVIGTPGIVYVSSDRVIAERADELALLVEVMDRASEYANANPDEVRAIDHEMTRLPPAYLDSRPIAPSGIRMNVERLAQLAQDMVEFGFASSAPSVDEILWEGLPR